jgi:phosphatidylglycerophosphate synthase
MATNTTLSQSNSPDESKSARLNPGLTGFRDAVRLQEAFTAAVEQRTLAWLAARLPHWVQPDHLTLLGFTAMFLAGASYALARHNHAGLLLASFFLACNWFGDSLDGTLARMRNRQRPRYGFYVDHVIDTVGGLFLTGGLALSGLLDWRISLGLYVGFLMLSVEGYLATYALGVFRLSCARFGPTEIRILLALGNVMLWLNPEMRVIGSRWRLFDFGGIVAIAVMGVMFVVLAVSHTVELRRQERLD